MGPVVRSSDMPDSNRTLMSLEAFLEWESHRLERYEYVDGQTVMMTGGTQAHSRIKINLVSTLRRLLKGKTCRPYDSDMKVLIPAQGNSRYPDASVDCGPYDPKALVSQKPTVVFEVLSEANNIRDQHLRLRDYGSVSTIQQYVVIAQTEAFAAVYDRDSAGNLVLREGCSDQSASLQLHSIDVELSMAELYDDVFPQLLEQPSGIQTDN